MLKEAVKNLFRKKATIDYPKGESTAPERFRGRQEYNKKACISCMACVRVCPNDAIVMGKGGGKIIIDLKSCIFCGLCAEVCPVKCLKMTRDFKMATKEQKELLIK